MASPSLSWWVWGGVNRFTAPPSCTNQTSGGPFRDPTARVEPELGEHDHAPAHRFEQFQDREAAIRDLSNIEATLEPTCEPKTLDRGPLPPAPLPPS